MRLNVAICLGFSALSYSYVLDEGCASMSPFFTKAMKGAFELAKAGVDIYYSPSEVPDILQAQKDLKLYMFEGSMYFQEEIQTVLDTLNGVLKYNTTSDGSPERTLDPGSGKGPYQRLTSKDLILFCNYDRFEEKNVTVSGKIVTKLYDTLLGYSKSRSYFLRYLLSFKTPSK